MPRRLRTTLTPGLLQDVLTLAQLDLQAWRPDSATPEGQARLLRQHCDTVVAFCPTFVAFRAFATLWEDAPYTLDVAGQWDGYLCTLTRQPA